jgi:hypothetical protein
MSISSANSDQKPLYFVNGWVDGFFIGAASIVYFLLINFFHSGFRTELVIQYGLALSWIVNWPHFSATSYRLYQSKDHIRQYTLTAYLIPIVVGLGIAGSFAYPEMIAPYFIKLFTIWSPYHFSGQTIGITLIYANRANIRLQKWERLMMIGFVYATYLFMTTKAETSTGLFRYYEVPYPSFGISLWIPHFFELIMYTSGLIFLSLMVLKAVKTKRSIPWIFFLPMASQYIWFVYGAGLASFQELVPFFHSLQYILIAWFMELHFRSSFQSNGVQKENFFLRTTIRWFLINFMGGVILFLAFPKIMEKAGFGIGFATAVCLAGVQIHHFFVDGVIWKLKNNSVSSPLMSSVSEIFGITKKSKVVL